MRRHYCLWPGEIDRNRIDIDANGRTRNGGPMPSIDSLLGPVNGRAISENHLTGFSIRTRYTVAGVVYRVLLRSISNDVAR